MASIDSRALTIFNCTREEKSTPNRPGYIKPPLSFQIDSAIECPRNWWSSNCPIKRMSSSCLYVDSPSKIGEVVGNCGCVRFVSLLTSIESNNDIYCLEMNNFTMGRPTSIPYRPILPKKHADSARSAKMVIELICNWYNLDIPELQSDTNFLRKGIHTLCLCFLECKVLYMTTPSGSSQNQPLNDLYLGYLESVKPFSFTQAQELALEATTDVGKTIRSILQNLQIMHQNSPIGFNSNLIQQQQQQFGFKHVPPQTQQSSLSSESENNLSRTSNSNGSHYPNSFRSTNSGSNNSSLNLASTNPIFPGNRLITAESQLDFNSINTQNDELSESELELEPEPKRKETSDAVSSPFGKSSSFPESNRSPPKRLKRSTARIDSKILNAEESDILELSGKFIAVHPLEDLIYFLPEGIEKPSHLYPGINCIEISSEAMPLEKEYTIEIERVEKPLFDDKFTLQWILKSPKPIPEPPGGRTRDRLIWFKDLNPPNADVLYVRMIALLVSSDPKQRGHFASVIFTDFTKNPALDQYPLFDKYVIRYEEKLHEDEGMRALLYNEHYCKFGAKVQKVYNKTLDQTYAPNSLNHSASRIVCLLTLKTKRYNGMLNAVAYGYEPIHPGMTLTLEERKHLFELHQRAIDTHNVHLLGDQISPFCVPNINADISDYTVEHCSNRQELEKATDDFLETKSSSQISSSLQFDHECFSIDAKILSFFTEDNPISHWTLLVAIKNDDAQANVISDDARFVDPRSILRIEIFGKENLEYFTARQASTTSNILQHLTQYQGKTCKLRLKRGYITLRSQIALLVWCPIELTLEELEVKLEES